MVASRYNFYTDEFELKNSGYILNVNTGSILGIPDKAVWDSLLQGGVEDIDSETKNVLFENGIIAKSHKEEFEGIFERRTKWENSTKKIQVTIIPTDSCNFACPYCFCYEKAGNFMTEETLKRMLELIEKRINNTEDVKQVQINWFGGEPTLAFNKIVFFMKKLTGICDNENVEIFSTMTTNGYLLDKSMFEELIKNRVNNVQFTIDGAKKAHDDLRYLKNGEATFDRIWNNLSEISKIDKSIEFKLDVRCNFTKKNLESVKKFIDEYIKEFGDDERFGIYCRPVYKYDTKDNQIDEMDGELFDPKEGLEIQNDLAQFIHSYDNERHHNRIFNPLPQPVDGWCNSEIANQIIVGPGGEIYTCETLTGLENSLGIIYDEKSENEWPSIRYNIFEDERTRKCMECRLLPLCMGGCLRNRLKSNASCFWDESTIQESLKKYIAMYI